MTSRFYTTTYKKSTAFCIAWADPSVASLYCKSKLRGDDIRRATLARSAKAQRDWQVSRALLHAVCAQLGEDQVCSLSHKAGYAVCASAPVGWKIGVDLERVHARDVLRLANWVCSKQERQTLLALSGHRRLLHFYTLWTLKEAFVKAADLVFPADMARVGLTLDNSLNAPPGRWQAITWCLAQNWVATAVWQAPTDTEQLPQWRTFRACRLPHLAALGQWVAT